MTQPITSEQQAMFTGALLALIQMTWQEGRFPLDIVAVEAEDDAAGQHKPVVNVWLRSGKLLRVMVVDIH